MGGLNIAALSHTDGKGLDSYFFSEPSLVEPGTQGSGYTLQIQSLVSGFGNSTKDSRLTEESMKFLGVNFIVSSATPTRSLSFELKYRFSPERPQNDVLMLFTSQEANNCYTSTMRKVKPHF